MKRALCLLLLVGSLAYGDEPITPCRFRIQVRVRSVYAPTPQTVSELVLDLKQLKDYSTRAEAQARAFEIAEKGYLHAAFRPTQNILFPPQVIVRVTVVPWPVNGDPGQCAGL